MPLLKSLKSIIRKNSAGSEFKRRRVNFIEGSNVTLTVADDSANNEVDVTIAASSGGTPGGSDTQIQFNDLGSFGGDANLTWDKTTNTLSANGNVGIGTAAPDARLDVQKSVTSGTPVTIIKNTNTG